jgi:hypothetical protein
MSKRIEVNMFPTPPQTFEVDLRMISIAHTRVVVTACSQEEAEEFALLAAQRMTLEWEDHEDLTEVEVNDCLKVDPDTGVRTSVEVAR